MLNLSGMYLITWILWVLFWIAVTVIVERKSASHNKTKNMSMTLIIALVLTFLWAAINPIRQPATTSSVDFSRPAQVEVPERIDVEDKLTDEQRAESLQNLRERSKMIEQEEFPDEDEPENDVNDNKGE